jgi:hypothetical protein
LIDIGYLQVVHVETGRWAFNYQEVALNFSKIHVHTEDPAGARKPILYRECLEAPVDRLTK